MLEAWTDLDFPLVWDDTQRQADRTDGALTFYFGGRRARRIAADDREALGRRLLERLDQVVPGVSAAATGRFVRTRWGNDPLAGGAYASFKPGQLTAFGEYLYVDSDDPDEQRDVYVDNLVFAGEQLSDLYYGFMNGGAETGRLAAQVVLRRVQEDAGRRPASRAA